MSEQKIGDVLNGASTEVEKSEQVDSTNLEKVEKNIGTSLADVMDDAFRPALGEADYEEKMKAYELLKANDYNIEKTFFQMRDSAFNHAYEAFINGHLPRLERFITSDESIPNKNPKYDIMHDGVTYHWRPEYLVPVDKFESYSGEVQELVALDLQAIVDVCNSLEDSVFQEGVDALKALREREIASGVAEDRLTNIPTIEQERNSFMSVLYHIIDKSEALVRQEFHREKMTKADKTLLEKLFDDKFMEELRKTCGLLEKAPTEVSSSCNYFLNKVIKKIAKDYKNHGMKISSDDKKAINGTIKGLADFGLAVFVFKLLQAQGETNLDLQKATELVSILGVDAKKSGLLSNIFYRPVAISVSNFCNDVTNRSMLGLLSSTLYPNGQVRFDTGVVKRYMEIFTDVFNNLENEESADTVSTISCIIDEITTGDEFRKYTEEVMAMYNLDIKKPTDLIADEEIKDSGCRNCPDGVCTCDEQEPTNGDIDIDESVDMIDESVDAMDEAEDVKEGVLNSNEETTGEKLVVEEVSTEKESFVVNTKVEEE